MILKKSGADGPHSSLRSEATARQAKALRAPDPFRALPVERVARAGVVIRARGRPVKIVSIKGNTFRKIYELVDETAATRFEDEAAAMDAIRDTPSLCTMLDYVTITKIC